MYPVIIHKPNTAQHHGILAVDMDQNGGLAVTAAARGCHGKRLGHADLMSSHATCLRTRRAAQQASRCCPISDKAGGSYGLAPRFAGLAGGISHQTHGAMTSTQQLHRYCTLASHRAHPDLSQGPAHLQSAALATELSTLLLSTNLMLLSIVALRLWIYIRVEGLR